MADQLDLDKIIKLLKLSASPVDAEAVAAVRKANEILLRFGGSWDDLLRGKVTIIEDPFNKMSAPEHRTNGKSPDFVPPRPKAPERPKAPDTTSPPWGPSRQQPKPKPQPQQTPMPQYSFAKSTMGTWCIKSPKLLASGDTIDVRTRAGGVRRVTILSLNSVNNYGDQLYTFMDAKKPDLDSLA